MSNRNKSNCVQNCVQCTYNNTTAIYIAFVLHSDACLHTFASCQHILCILSSINCMFIILVPEIWTKIEQKLNKSVFRALYAYFALVSSLVHYSIVSHAEKIGNKKTSKFAPKLIDIAEYNKVGKKIVPSLEIMQVTNQFILYEN